MKKLLVLSPHFPPVNAPDMQRIRLALPFLRDLGWEPTVLAIAPESIEGRVIDLQLERTYPADIRVIRVKGLSARYTRWAGVGNLWWRCGAAYARAGRRLLEAERFDLAFITTTQFDAFGLGPRWLKAFGLPYVLDYQDPWVNDYYARTGAAPPGGRLKFALSQWVARRVEPRALRGAAGVVAVSDGYGPMLKRLYPWFDPSGVRLIPFGASEADYRSLGDYRPARPIIPFGDGFIHHVYAGRCGPDMTFAMTVLFRAFKRYLKLDPERAGRFRFHFIGTDYSPPPMGRDWAMPIARAEGLERFVDEHRHRVPYFDALYYLRGADALLALGSNDPSYSASKIFPYMLARRPLLLIFHEVSPVLAFARRASVGARFSFRKPEDVNRLADDVLQAWFVGKGSERYVPFEEESFAEFSAGHLTVRLAKLFDEALARR